MADGGGAASYVDKWLRVFPEMALLEPFCPPAQRGLLRLWGALQHELTLAMFDASDGSVTRTKLSWWGDDLAAGRSGSQHPLARALLLHDSAAAVAPAQWRQLALAATALGSEARDCRGARLPESALQACAGHLAVIEGTLFDAVPDPDAVRAALAIEHLLRRRSDPGVPRAAAELQPAAALPGAALYRCGRLQFDRWRLQRLAAGPADAGLPPIPPWRGLLMAWRAGRRSRAAVPR